MAAGHRLRLERLDPERVVVLETGEVEPTRLGGTHRVHSLAWEKQRHAERDGA